MNKCAICGKTVPTSKCPQCKRQVCATCKMFDGLCLDCHTHKPDKPFPDPTTANKGKQIDYSGDSKTDFETDEINR